MARFRDWCFTLNNYEDDEVDLIRQVFGNIAVYGVFGREIAPTTGTRHLQCYVYFPNAKTFSAVRKFFPKRIAELAPRYQSSTPDQAREYCKKEGDFEEFGNCPDQGKRTDLDQIKELVKSGRGMREIVNCATSYQSVRMGEMLLKYNERSRDWLTEVTWIHGASGTGKSLLARDLCDGNEAYWAMNTSKWWEGYDAHEIVIIDDFRREFCTWQEFLRMTDRYPWRVETKGGSRQFLAKKIIITCPQSPEDFMSIWTNEELKQGLRRISEIIFLS